jgi:glutaredoxin 3
MIEVYGRPNCNWCVKAKELLNSKGINYRYNTVGEDIGINEITEMFPGVRTVPIIAVDGKRIGGYEELKEYLEETAGGFGDGAF